MQLSVKEILAQGFVEYRIKLTGVIQLHRFNVVREKTPFGEVPFLVAVTTRPLTQGALVSAAEVLGLPIKASGITVYPKGKMAKDFVGL
jgi:hypothetical protein